MSFNSKLQRDLEDILTAGASLELSVKGKLNNHLIDLAASAKRGNSHLTLTNASGLLTRSLVDIASSGRGHVTFKD